MMTDYLLVGLLFYLPTLVVCVLIMRVVTVRWVAILASFVCIAIVTYVLLSIEMGMRNSLGSGGPHVLWRAWAAPVVMMLLPFIPSPKRRRRSQCPACAYPIGQSPVCTECGAAVIQTSVAAAK